MTWRLFFTDTDYMLSNNCLLRSSTSTTSSAENQGTLRISFHSFLLWHDSFAGILNRMRMACSRISNICAYFTFSSIHLFICLYKIIAVFLPIVGFFVTGSCIYTIFGHVISDEVTQIKVQNIVSYPCSTKLTWVFKWYITHHSICSVALITGVNMPMIGLAVGGSLVVVLTIVMIWIYVQKWKRQGNTTRKPSTDSSDKYSEVWLYVT